MAWIRWRHSRKLGREYAVIEWRDEAGRIKTDSSHKFSRAEEQKARNRALVIEAGLSPTAGLAPAKAYQRFLADLSASPSVSEGTVRHYREKLNLLLRDWDGKPWTHWTVPNLTKWHHKYAQDKAPRTAQMMEFAIHRFLGWCESRDMPIRATRLPVSMPRRKKAGNLTLPSSEDVQGLCGASDGDPQIRALVSLAAYAGCRRNEAFHICWEDVDFDANTVRIRSPKTHQTRVVPLHPELAAALVPLGAGEGEILDLPTGRHLYTRVKALYTRCGVDYAVGRPLHVLRHWFVSRLLETGAPVHVARDLAGHASIATTNIYAHALKEQMREAVGRL